MSCNSDHTFFIISYVEVSKYNKYEPESEFLLKKHSLRMNWDRKFDSNFPDWMLTSINNISEISKLVFTWVVHVYALSCKLINWLF